MQKIQPNCLDNELILHMCKQSNVLYVQFISLPSHKYNIIVLLQFISKKNSRKSNYTLTINLSVMIRSHNIS